MTDCTHKIDCNVERCCYNENGLRCSKREISVCRCSGGTCCASFKDSCECE